MQSKFDRSIGNQIILIFNCHFVDQNILFQILRLVGSMPNSRDVAGMVTIDNRWLGNCKLPGNWFHFFFA